MADCSDEVIDSAEDMSIFLLEEFKVLEHRPETSK
jgi:hypothetical protein